MANHQNYVLLENSKTVKFKNSKTENIKHISGNEVTSEMSPSGNSVTSTRGAETPFKSKFDYIRYYKEAAREIKSDEIYYVSASVKGLKSNSKRREVNLDVVPKSGDKQLFLKSFTVDKSLKWELFRDLPDAEKISDTWCIVEKTFREYPTNTKAGKLITRRKYRTVPKFRLGNCAVVTRDIGNKVIVTLLLEDREYTIECDQINTNDKGSEFFMYRGDWKNSTEMEVI